jgi:hypothetical protein
MAKKAKWLVEWEREQAEFYARTKRRLVTKERVGLIELVKIIRYFTGVDLKTGAELGKYLRDSGIVKKLKERA